MKFNELEYKRLDYNQTSKKLESLVNRLEEAKSAENFLTVFKEIDKINSHMETMISLCYVRHSIDTSNKFYDEENDYWDQTIPKYQVYFTKIAKIMCNTKFKDELYQDIGETYFKMAEYEIMSFDEKIIPLLQEENKLTSEYDKLKAKAKVEFEGKIYNLSTIQPFTESENRDIRKRSYDAKIKFYEENESEFDRIYDQLVKVRDKIAKELGFKNFTELGYIRMNRLDYNQEMVSQYRKEILAEVVPFVSELNIKQAKRLGLNSLKYYDKSFKFKSGNPKPKGNPKELVSKAINMYEDMSNETSNFIHLMNDNNLWDLESKENKSMGGYCTTFPDFKLPFIFSNFNGTSGDVDVLTHEAGHAFQAFMSKDIFPTALQSPTLESCEIHSMSMEFFAYKYMKDFFKEDVEKYFYSHLSSTFSFLPYGVLVDHFQHEVYNNPNMTASERKDCWRKLEKMYLPTLDYEDNDFLDRGNFWFQQGHIFSSPFYYIDYTLAQVCALQFWNRMITNDEDYWTDYINLCKLGGTKSFVNLVKAANLKVPFQAGCLKDVVKNARNYLNSIDDSKL